VIGFAQIDGPANSGHRRDQPSGSVTNALTGQVLFAKGIASSDDLGAIAKATRRNFWTGPCLLVGGKHPAGARVAFGRQSARPREGRRRTKGIVAMTQPDARGGVRRVVADGGSALLLCMERRSAKPASFAFMALGRGGPAHPVTGGLFLSNDPTGRGPGCAQTPVRKRGAGRAMHRPGTPTAAGALGDSVDRADSAVTMARVGQWFLRGPLQRLDSTGGRGHTVRNREQSAGRPPRAGRVTRLRGHVLVAVGSCVVVVALGLYGAISTSSGRVLAAAVGASVAGIGSSIFGAGVSLYRRARQLEARSASGVLAESNAAPVLYLRSFVEDVAAARRLQHSSYSQEEQMVAVLARIGPVVGIGRPGEELPELGAARDYVSDDEWKAWVLSTMRRAALVVFRAGDTEGFWWEVATAFRELPRQRIAFLIPQDANAYQSFRSGIASCLDPELPTTLPPVKWFVRDTAYGITEIWGMLYFDEHGRVRLRQVRGLDSVADALIRSYSRRHSVHFEKLFKPLLRREGVGRPRPTVLGAILVTLTFWMIVPMYALARRTSKLPPADQSVEEMLES
jgi:hypothetical protein